MREFDTGATRDTDVGKIDYEGFLSPAALKAYGEYMTRHQLQADGKRRDSDNWQKGIPRAAYVKSLLRHVFELWGAWRGTNNLPPTDERLKDVLCAILFNVVGLLHEVCLGRAVGKS